MAILILLNNFLHDFSAAGWLFGSVLLYLSMKGKDPNNFASKELVDVFKTVILLMKISLVGIVVFGVVRLLAYKSFEWSEAAGQSQVTLLIVKHVIFTVIFIYGLIYYLKARRIVRKNINE